MSVSPDLSIMLTIVDSGPTLERCLNALAAQDLDGNTIEVLVPYDHMSKDAGAFAKKFPDFTFMDLGEIFDGKVPSDALEMHAFYDKRRSEALKVAKGRLVGIIEDRGLPEPGWARSMIRLHAEKPHGVIGGAVTNGVDKLWNWAIFFCDFGRYGPPLSDDDPEYVTDTNIVYKRETLFAHQDLWDDQYKEAQLHWAMKRAGEKMMLTDKAITKQHRPPFSVGKLVKERFHWARMFGQVRGAEISSAERLKYCLATPILPFVLFLRHFRRQIGKGRDVGKFVMAAPLTLFLLFCWSAGELVGYTEATPKPD